MSRAAEPGWRQIIASDTSGRRSVWFRRDGEALEICGGREGDDVFVRLDNVTKAQEDDLRGVFETARWVGELACRESL